MQANDVIPFLDATRRVFDTMLRMSVSFGEPMAGAAAEGLDHDVSGIIGISGDLVGALVLVFPGATAESCAGALAGRPVGVDDELFIDAIGELANMVSGAAKSRCEGKRLSIGCPTVVTGPGHRVHQLSDARGVCVPCGCEAGTFYVVVSLRGAGAGSAAA
jgi:chemotaxis protein CheX